jgi:hypothetical protein
LRQSCLRCSSGINYPLKQESGLALKPGRRLILMTKLKSLNKKLRRLEASLQKDAKKLAKLQRKVEEALRAEPAPAKTPIRVEKAPQPAMPAAPPAKKKRALTAAGREKLSAMMKARWAAKRAAAAGSAAVGQPQNREA